MSNGGAEGKGPTGTLLLDSASRARSGVEEAELAADILRLRTAVAVGSAVWASAVGLDALIAGAFAPDRFHALVALRVIGLAASGACWAILRRPGLSRGALRLVSVGIFTLTSVLFGAMSVVVGTSGSPYFVGVLTMLLVYGPVASAPFRRGALDAAAPVLAWPATIFAGTFVSDALATELRDRTARTVFIVCLVNLALAYVVVVVSGRAAWALRRQVYASRGLGRYKLKRLLGAGGMGEVWLAHHAALKRDVAVKVLRRDRALIDAHAAARFEREARATSELAHPNTVRIYDYGLSDDGVWYYAMELLAGESLGALVRRDGPLNLRRALALLHQATSALAEAHAKQIVHRDVTPENLFVVSGTGAPEFVKVLDFGIAKVLSEPDGAKLTRTGNIVGTPAWMAPEALLGGETDARADVYSLGAVLYFAVTGRSPFAAGKEVQLTELLSRRAYVPMGSHLGSPVPEELERVVARCLETEPSLRFASAQALAEAFEGWARGTGGAGE